MLFCYVICFLVCLLLSVKVECRFLLLVLLLYPATAVIYISLKIVKITRCIKQQVIKIVALGLIPAVMQL